MLALVVPVATSQEPSFPAESEIVTVDVVVTDSDGQPVLDLRPEDFTVAEDGARQEVVAFEAIHRAAPEPAPAAPDAAETTLPAPVPPPPEPRTSSNQVPAARQGSHFIVVFDELHMTPAEAQRGRVAVREFLETGAAIRDRVALVGTAEGTRWTAVMPGGRGSLLEVLDRLQGRVVNETVRDRMTDYEAMRIAQDRDPLVLDVVMRRFLETGSIQQDTASPGNPNDPSTDVGGWRSQTEAAAAAAYARSAARNQQTLGVVERTLESLGSVRGRKSLVFVSGGLVNDPRLSVARQVVTAARRVNAAIYFLDVRGLEGAPLGLTAEAPARTFSYDLGSWMTESRERSEGSEGLAADTGGFSLKNRNDLADGLARVARESRHYYLLGYAPTNRRADGSFREIEVEVSREGVSVRARRGYYAPGGKAAVQKKPETADAAMQRALDSPYDQDDVPLRAITHVFGPAATAGQATVQVTVEADIRSLQFVEKGGTARDTLELLLLVARQDNGEFSRFDQQFEMKLSPESRARYERSWLPITREVDLAPGRYQAKIVARDRNGGRLGSLTHDFEVPETDGLRISTLALSDRVRDGAAGGAPELTARRRFPAAGMLHCRFEVYGAAVDKATGKPRVTAGFSIRRADGRFLAAGEETPVAPGADGSLVRGLGVALEGAPPGTYEMIVVATDLVGERSAVIREPFVIEAEAGS